MKLWKTIEAAFPGLIWVLILLSGVAVGTAADISAEMLTATRSGDVGTVTRLLANGEDVNAANPEGVTALMVAADENRLSVVRAFLDAGADARMKTASGKTAAFFASAKGNTEVAEILEAAASKPPAMPKASLLVSADLSSVWKLDGEMQGRLAQGAMVKVQVEFGKHLIEAQSEDGRDQFRKVVEITSGRQELVTIEINSTRTARLQAEAEAKLTATEQQKVRAAQEDLATNPTWQDPATGLLWSRNGNINLAFAQANLRCQNLSLEGKSGWRLATEKELATLYDPSVNKPVTYTNGESGVYHIKTSISLASEGAWSSSSFHSLGHGASHKYYDFGAGVSRPDLYGYMPPLAAVCVLGAKK